MLPIIDGGSDDADDGDGDITGSGWRRRVEDGGRWTDAVDGRRTAATTVEGKSDKNTYKHHELETILRGFKHLLDNCIHRFVSLLYISYIV